MSTALRSLVEKLHEATSDAPAVGWEIDDSRKPKLNQKGTKVSIRVFLTSSEGNTKEIEMDLPDLDTMVVEVYSASDGASPPVPLKNHYWDYLHLKPGNGVRYKPKLEFRPRLTMDYDELTLAVGGELNIEALESYECPVCEGKGYDVDDRDEYSHSSGHYTSQSSSKCEECNGSGDIQIDDTFDISLEPELSFDEYTGNLVKVAKRSWTGVFESRA